MNGTVSFLQLVRISVHGYAHTRMSVDNKILLWFLEALNDVMKVNGQKNVFELHLKFLYNYVVYNRVQGCSLYRNPQTICMG